MCQHRSPNSLTAQRLPDLQNPWECLTSKHQTCSLDDLVASFSAVRISATISHPAPNLNFGCKNIPKPPSFEVPSSLTLSGKTPLLSSFCTETSKIQTSTLSEPILSPRMPFPMSSSFQSVQRLLSCSLPSLLILTPIPGEAPRPKNTIQARAEILNLLHTEPPPFCVATPLVK